MKEKRENLNISDKDNYDARIFHLVTESEEYKKAGVIFIYVSYNHEADTHSIICRALKDNKTVCVPKIISKLHGMKAVQIKSFKELKPGAYGILEPENNCGIDAENIDLVILPGLAFDADGGRLGYGAGFYDRFLCGLRDDAKLIGIGYKFQIVNKVPMESYDHRIHRIITD